VEARRARAIRKEPANHQQTFGFERPDLDWGPRRHSFDCVCVVCVVCVVWVAWLTEAPTCHLCACHVPPTCVRAVVALSHAGVRCLLSWLPNQCWPASSSSSSWFFLCFPTTHRAWIGQERRVPPHLGC